MMSSGSSATSGGGSARGAGVAFGFGVARGSGVGLGFGVAGGVARGGGKVIGFIGSSGCSTPSETGRGRGCGRTGGLEGVAAGAGWMDSRALRNKSRLRCSSAEICAEERGTTRAASRDNPRTAAIVVGAARTGGS